MMTIALVGLPPGTLKTDVRLVFQLFGEVRRIFFHPGGRRADVVFADVEGVRRSLHAYAERPLSVRGREILVSRKHHAHSAGVGVGGGNVASRAPFYMRDEQDGDGGNDGRAIFVSDFPAGTTQEELSDVFTPLGKYEQFVMRMCRFLSNIFFFSADSYIVRSPFAIRVFRVFERGSRRRRFACPRARSDHLSGATLAHRALQGQTVHFVGRA